MIRPSLALLALGAVSMAGAPAAVAQIQPPPRSLTAPGPTDDQAKAKPATKPKPRTAKPADGGKSEPKAGWSPQRGYSDELPLPRKIERGDIADPYGGVGTSGGPRVTPTLTPSGGMGVGGRF